ncbi:uncharacterized protein LOC114441633 [Parambassis ranga]|uniref:Uncharacterized protein LOC114441633 n=1 Tax=Parambassis ranga TaxID=210632 RepID=A0A6P7J186_9TELE|nr:uncharacterized protein LOC114441633 [Parambassis ranga]
MLGPLLKQDQPTTHPTQPLVTQMQPPILPPPPHPNFQSMRLPVTMTSTVLGAAFQHLYNESLRPTSALTHLQHEDSDEMLSVSQGANVHVVSPVSQKSSSKLPVGGLLGFLKLDLYTPTTTQSHTAAPQAPQSQPPITLFHSSFRNTLSAVSQTPHTHPQQSFTLSFLPKFHLELSTLQLHLPSMKPSQPSTAISQTQSESSPTQRPPLSFSTFQPPPTLEPEVIQQNATPQGPPVQSVKSANDTELTNWLKRNTSQSPMTSNDPRVTQQSPSWLPMLEKHDIPIVVGVGVSLAFIFITVTFYSVVQKNEPAPTSRAGQSSSISTQRKLGVPIRHTERRAAGRTYENRAFEDDDSVAVIEQSPNTSDTRARPPGPSLVTVQMEPTFEELQEVNTTPTVDNHSVTVETYPEPIVDTKIDPCLEDEKGCSLSQPSIQLQCAEDWTSNRGDNHSPCHDALPPPSSLPSCSPSPSPPSRREEGLHSSLTLHSAEPCVAPIHHSLSISHGSPPLLLSHHVSLGLTTVAVDVHFYPTATASMAASTSTHIHSVSNATSVTAPLFSPPLVNSQDSNQSTARYHQSK